MDFKKEQKITMVLSGEEFRDLCKLIDHGRYRLEDWVADLKKEEKRDNSTIDSHLRLIEVSKIYTNERAKL